MHTATLEAQSLLVRVERLERQNRLLKRGAIVLLLASVSLMTMAQARPARIVEAQDFILVDSSGAKRAELSLDQHDASLKFFDSKGLPSSFVTDGFVFLAEPGHPEAGAVSLGMYQGKKPLVEVDGSNGFSAILGTTDTVTTKTGELHTTSAASLTLFSKDRKVIWSAP